MYHLILLGKENNLCVLDGNKDSIEKIFELIELSQTARRVYRAIWIADVLNKQVVKVRVYEDVAVGENSIFGPNFVWVSL